MRLQIWTKILFLSKSLKLATDDPYQGFSIDIDIDIVSIFDTIDIDIRYYFGEAIDIADINIS